MGNELSAISVLLVFVSVAFSLVVQNVWSEFYILISPLEKKEEIRNSRLSEIKKLLFFKVFPLGFFVLLLGWVLTPKSFSIVSTSRLDFFDFDLLSTLYVLINLSVYVMLFVICVIIVRLLLRICEVNRHFS